MSESSPWLPRDLDAGANRCDECHGWRGVWRTSNHLWQEVVGDDGVVLCPSCFMRRAEGKHIGLRGSWVLMPPRLTISEPRRRPQ